PTGTFAVDLPRASAAAAREVQWAIRTGLTAVDTSFDRADPSSDSTRLPASGVFGAALDECLMESDRAVAERDLAARRTPLTREALLASPPTRSARSRRAA